MPSGIYQIKNIHTDESYVGQALDIDRRWRGHFAQLRSSTHHNHKLQRSYDLFGEAAFATSVLEFSPVLQLDSRENHWIDALSPVFNLSPGPRRRGEARERPRWQEKIPGSNLIRAHCQGCDEIIRVTGAAFRHYDVFCRSCREDEIRLDPALLGGLIDPCR